MVTIREKLFVVGNVTYSIEVFDNASKVFTALKPSPTFIDLNKALSVGNKIVIFQEKKSSVICYDINKDEWSEEPCELTKNLESFSCLKLPLY